jgi:hypothetical protein
LQNNRLRPTTMHWPKCPEEVILTDGVVDLELIP